MSYKYYALAYHRNQFDLGWFCKEKNDYANSNKADLSVGSFNAIGCH